MPIDPPSSRPIASSTAVRAASPMGMPRKASGASKPTEHQAERSVVPQEEGFADHLSAAIALNRKRRDVYDRLSGGASRSLSNTLIALEFASLPAAHALDLWAKRFQAQGISVLKDDFVSMQNVPSPFAPPRWKEVASDQDASQVEKWLGDYRKRISTALDENDFSGIAQASYDLLSRLEGAESESRTHWAMSKHLVESLGLSAMNAISYADQSGGETLRLSRAIIRYQSLGLMGAVGIDRQAQTLHQRGIGILVNDIPQIPFAQNWAALGSTKVKPSITSP